MGRIRGTDRKKHFIVSVAVAVFLWSACLSWAAEAETVYATIGPIDVLGSGPHHLDLGFGLANINRPHRLRGAGKIELRVGRKFAFVGPAVGLYITNEGFSYGYAGIYADLGYGRFILTPLIAAGVCHQGNGIDLGGPFQFRESLEIAYRVDERWLVGLSIAHISNGQVYENNPGQNDLLLTIAVGF
ncbi:MAG: acyloxyacyl hydrolase [Candidatus Deferrimicrobiaceae bacterium]